MNCRKGDLAFIVGLMPALDGANDRVVRCIEQSEGLGEETMWRLDRDIELVLPVDGRCSRTNTFFPAGSVVYFDELPDRHLRPIRGGLVDAYDARVPLVTRLEVTA